MTLSRTEVAAGLPAELLDMAGFIRSISDGDWATPTRCTGWTVADVAAHVAGTMTDIANGQFEGLGLPAVTEREVAERRGRSRSELADELEGAAKISTDLLAAFDDAAWDGPAPPGVTGTLGAGVEALWSDAYLHIQDMRAALGLAPERKPALRASLSHVASVLGERGWAPATLALDGMGRFDVAAGGREITGDPLAFVLAATGRGDPSAFGLGPDVNIYAD